LYAIVGRLAWPRMAGDAFKDFFAECGSDGTLAVSAGVAALWRVMAHEARGRWRPARGDP